MTPICIKSSFFHDGDGRTLVSPLPLAGEGQGREYLGCATPLSRPFGPPSPTSGRGIVLRERGRAGRPGTYRGRAMDGRNRTYKGRELIQLGLKS